MPFIGQQPTSGLFIELDSLTASATDQYTLQLNGANYYPESVNNLLVSINGVIQGSNTLSLSGSTLTVGATLSASDVIDFVRVFGNVGTISTPTDGSVTANKIASGAVDLTTKVTGVLPVANGGTGFSARPAFFAHRLASGTQSLSAQTDTLAAFNETDHNVGGHYNTSTYTFTCPVSGLYQFQNWCYVYNTTQTNAKLYINGSKKYRFSSVQTDTANNPHGAGGGISISLSTNDTVQLYVWANENANLYAGDSSVNERASFFSGYLIG